MSKKVWVDGCFDIIHYGHVNLINQAKAYGDSVVVGIHSNEEISKHKRIPVMQVIERQYVLKALKGVSDVVCGAPFVTSVDMLDKYNCDLCVHGDDNVFCQDGTDPYTQVKLCNRYQEVPRTETVSTTDIISKFLFPYKFDPMFFASHRTTVYEKFIAHSPDLLSHPKPGQKIVYVGGRFDLLHPYLISYFKKLKDTNNFLVVGIIGDEDIYSRMFPPPLLCSYERGLAVMACIYVDKVVFDAPLKLTEEFLDFYSIDKIYYGDMDYIDKFREENYKNIDPEIICNIPLINDLRFDFIGDRIRGKRSHYLKKLKYEYKSKEGDQSTSDIDI